MLGQQSQNGVVVPHHIQEKTIKERIYFRRITENRSNKSISKICLYSEPSYWWGKNLMDKLFNRKRGILYRAQSQISNMELQFVNLPQEDTVPLTSKLLKRKAYKYLVPSTSEGTAPS
jgi:hypothetical protein